MKELKVYEVEINGIKHTMQFPEGEQPKGAVEVEAKASTPDGEQPDGEQPEGEVEAKASTPANKGRAAANKKH